MKIIDTPMHGVCVLEPKIFGDARGYFYESYNENAFRELGIQYHFIQDNESRSVKGVLRGLHFQKEPFAQAKLVRVTEGAVFDVIVDIRKGSPTFGKWFGIELTAENKTMVMIPFGFAHGFQVLSEQATFCYKVSGAFYSPTAERALLWNDASVGVKWKTLDVPPILSKKDADASPLASLDTGFVFKP
jgi:dTDP-4-dehydrorhamnose 3,5-epimerase